MKDRLSPAEQGETFKVPALMSEVQGELAFADTDIFMEFHDWSLLDHSSRLGEAEFAIRETARRMARNSGARRIDSLPGRELLVPQLCPPPERVLVADL